MHVFLRPQFGDRRVAEEALGTGLYDGLHLSALSPSFVWEWATGLNVPLIVDLPSYIFTLRPEALFESTAKEVRKSVRCLADGLGGCIAAAAGKRQLSAKDFLSDAQALPTLVKNALRYEEDLLRGQLQLFDPYYEKYRVLVDRDVTQAEASAPLPRDAIFVPPYFLIGSPDDLWFRVSIDCARFMEQGRSESVRIFVPLLVAPQLLERSEDVQRIAEEYLGLQVDGYLLWVNGLREEDADEGKLRGITRCVKLLASGGRAVYKLYGSYFSALLHAKGMCGFSCGLGYGMTKSIYSYGKGGGKREVTYFIGPLGRAFKLSEAEYLLQRFPLLRCGCSVCHEAVGNKPHSLSQMLQPEMAQRHFVQSFRNEVEMIAREGVPTVTARLRRLARELGRKGVDASHLLRWSNVVEE